jgi:hypothetical protein
MHRISRWNRRGKALGSCGKFSGAQGFGRAIFMPKKIHLSVDPLSFFEKISSHFGAILAYFGH